MASGIVEGRGGRDEKSTFTPRLVAVVWLRAPRPEPTVYSIYRTAVKVYENSRAVPKVIASYKIRASFDLKL